MLFIWWKRPRGALPGRARQYGRPWRPALERLEERRVPSSLIALTTNNQLLAFDSSSPGTIQAKVPVTGLQPGESILSIDVRPGTGQLYGLGSSNRLYVINTTGAAAQVGTGTFAIPLNGTAFGFNFDPVADRIRVVSNKGQNMRLNPDTGAVIDFDPSTPGIQPDTNLNPPGDIVAAAYTNNVVGATSTTLYGIDAASDMFVQIGGTNGTPAADLGAVTPVTSLGADASDQAGLDIGPDNTGFAALTVGGVPQLIRVSLATGPSPVGPIGDGSLGIRGLAVVIPPPPPPPPPTPSPSSDTLLAVTQTNELLRFNSDAPSTITSTTPITGLQPGESVFGIDIRTATGQLYALGSSGRLYTVNAATGAATQVGSGTFAVPLSGVAFGFSFDPVSDRIRVVSDANLNMRIDPDSGAVVDTDPNSPGTQPDAFLSSTYTVGLAYSNSVAGATASTLYGIDGANDWLVRVGGPNGNPSPSLGQVTVIGPMGIDDDWWPVPHAPFDITAGGVPYLALSVGGRTSLYTIDLNTGRATVLAPIGTGATRILGLTSTSVGQFVIASGGTTASEDAGAFHITVNRTGGSAGVASVNYGTADGTATAGRDYAPTFGTLVFQDGETSKSITIPIINDGITDGPETLGVGLADPTGGATLGTPSTAVLTITDGTTLPPGGGLPPAPGTVPPGLPPSSGPASRGIFVTGADAGGGPDIKIFAADGTYLGGGFAFDPRFTGGVRVAAGDVNGDGYPDIICGAGPGGGPNVIVFSGRDRSLLYNFFAFDMNFTGGVYVAAGDVNGDGFGDIIVSADAGGGPNVTVFSGRDRSPLLSFFPYDMQFTGGVRVAAGDVSGDGRTDIITGAGPGGGPNVTVYQFVNGAPQEIQSYFAFDPRVTAGIFVGAGDVDGDRHADVIAGTGSLSSSDVQIVGAPSVAVVSGASALPLNRFTPFPPPFAGAVRVASTDLAGNGRASVIAVHGPGGTPDVDIFDAMSGQLIDRFFAYDPNFTGGLFVANSTR